MTSNMKYCPSCLSQFSDLTLKFCLQDGTPLSTMPQASPKQSTIDTVAFSHPVTAQRLNPTQDIRMPDTSERTQANIRVEPPKAKRSRKGMIAAILGIPAVLILGAGGVFGWLYYEKGHTASSFNAQIAAPENKPVVEEQVPAPPAQPASVSDSKKEIADLVEQWKLHIESRKTENVTAMYAETVEYLGKADTSSREIGTELQKTFDAYNAVDLDITNLAISLSEDGSSATALFDREWSYTKMPDLVEGKAHTRLRFEKLAGSGWRIVSEKDLKVYFEES